MTYSAENPSGGGGAAEPGGGEPEPGGGRDYREGGSSGSGRGEPGSGLSEAGPADPIGPEPKTPLDTQESSDNPYRPGNELAPSTSSTPSAQPGDGPGQIPENAPSPTERATPSVQSPPGLLDKLKSVPGPVGATASFGDNYLDMRAANTKGADKFYHCMANCDATSKAGSPETAFAIDLVRELTDVVKYTVRDGMSMKDALADSMSDMRANMDGFRGGARGMRCEDACRSHKPSSLP